MIPTIEELREQYAALIKEVQDIRDGAETRGGDMTEDEVRSCNEKMDEADKVLDRIKSEERAKPHLKPAMTQAEAVETRDATTVLNARPKNPDAEEKTYRMDNFREKNFWADMLQIRQGNFDARERMVRNNEQAKEWNESQGRFEARDMGTGSTAGGDFLPPLYLADLWTRPNDAGRPLADRLPKYPLPELGTDITIPALSSGVSVDGRLSGGTVSETDGVTGSVTHKVNEIAGLVDIDRIAVMRTDPGLQKILTEELVRRYNVKLDGYLISGSGTAPQHKGLDQVVTGSNDITWTQASPTPAKFLSQVLNAISQVNTNRIEKDPDLIVVHGRRAVWAAQPNGSTFPVLQLGALFHSSGTFDNGFAESIAGLEVVRDNNITTTTGSGTNQDRVYVMCSSDFLLAEGPLYARVHEDVGSGTGAIRFAVFAHSAFLSNRYPSAVARISGTGLAAATFDS